MRNQMTRARAIAPRTTFMQPVPEPADMPAIYQPALKELGLGTNGNGNGGNGNYGWLPLGVLAAIGVAAYVIHRSNKRDEEYAEYARKGWIE